MFDVNCTPPRAGLTEEMNFNLARDEVVLIVVKPFCICAASFRRYTHHSYHQIKKFANILFKPDVKRIK